MRRSASSPAAAAAAAESTSFSSPPSAMPRMSFSLRPSALASPPRPLASPPWPPADATVLFTGDVWLPSKVVTFLSFAFGSKWTRAAAAVWMGRVADVPPLLHLRLDDRAYVVTAIHQPPRGRADNSHADKTQILLEVKTLDDVRRAVLYHTAAASSTLAFYVDAANADHQLLESVMLQALASPQPSRPLRPPSPPLTVQAAPSAVDHAFDALRDARAKHQRGHVVDALAAYAMAERAFAVAAKPSGQDPAELARIQAAQREIRAAAAALEMEKALPRTVASVASPTETTAPTGTITRRLEDLQTFAHTRNVDRAQRARRVHADDLTLRLHALRNEKATAPSVESLETRLDRLRGRADVDGGRVAVGPTKTLSPVDQIVQQAMDEVALGIVDEDAHATASEEDDSDDDASVSSSSDAGSDERRQTTRRR